MASLGQYELCNEDVTPIKVKCPPAELPIIPILLGSRPYFSACDRTRRMVRCKSSQAVICLCKPLGRGVRYRSVTTVIPKSLR